MAIKKNVIKIETRRKGKRSWTCVVTKEDNGKERDNHIFDPELAKFFTVPGEYEVNMEKNDEGYWNIVEVVSSPEGKARAIPENPIQTSTTPVFVAAHTNSEIVLACLAATARLYSGSATSDAGLAGFYQNLQNLVDATNDIIAGKRIGVRAIPETADQGKLPL